MTTTYNIGQSLPITNLHPQVVPAEERYATEHLHGRLVAALARRRPRAYLKPKSASRPLLVPWLIRSLAARSPPCGRLSGSTCRQKRGVLRSRLYPRARRQDARSWDQISKQRPRKVGRGGLTAPDASTMGARDHEHL